MQGENRRGKCPGGRGRHTANGRCRGRSPVRAQAAGGAIRESPRVRASRCRRPTWSLGSCPRGGRDNRWPEWSEDEGFSSRGDQGGEEAEDRTQRPRGP